MKLFHALLPVLLLLTLTACGGDSPASTESVSDTPASPAASSSSPAQPEHLEFYDQFDHYNHADEHDFTVSEILFNGELSYCFRNDEYEHPILIYAVPHSSDSTAPYRATLLVEGFSSLDFEMPIFILGYGNVSGAASFDLADLTGDEIPELVYCYGSGGQGFWYSQVKVFDLASLTELPVLWNEEALSALVQLTPVELIPNTDSSSQYSTMAYAITGPDEQTVYGTAAVADGTPFEAEPARFGDNTQLGLQDDRLVYTGSFSSLYAAPMCYLGDLAVPFVYDSATASFVLGDAFTLTVHDPVDPSIE